MFSQTESATSHSSIGGEKLRSLRRTCQDEAGKRLTIDKLAREAGFDYRTVSDIERGVAKRPPRETIYRILATLDGFGPVPTEDKNVVLSAYGYQVLFQPPTQLEIERACQLWLEGYEHIHLPSYLVSYDQRLLIWNRYAPRVLGMALDTPETEDFKNLRIFDMVFNPQLPSALRLLNADELAPKLLALIKTELQPFRDEEWYIHLIHRTSQDYPAFKIIWDSIPDDLDVVTMRTVGPILIQYGENAVLSFNIYASDFVSDPRFRVVQYHPADGATIKIWNTWVEEEELARDDDVL